MAKKSNIFLGFVFVVLGISFLLRNMGMLDFQFLSLGRFIGLYWASLFLILPALFFHSIYFAGRTYSAGLLVPAGILLVVGVTCQISMLFDAWHILWPGFILAPAFGLFELYLFGKRHLALLIPVSLLGALSGIFFVFLTPKWSLFGTGFDVKHMLVAGILIFLGITVLMKDGYKQNAF